MIEPEDAWCGKSYTEEEIREAYIKDVANGDTRTWEQYLGDWL